jgi:ATP-dependent Lon protease
MKRSKRIFQMGPEDAIMNGSFFELNTKSKVSKSKKKDYTGVIQGLKDRFEDTFFTLEDILELGVSDDSKIKLLHQYITFNSSGIFADNYIDQKNKLYNTFLQFKNFKKPDYGGDYDLIKNSKNSLVMSKNNFKEFKKRIFQSGMSLNNKSIAYNLYKGIKSDPESKEKEILNSLLRIPFGSYSSLITDENFELQTFIKEAKQKMDDEISYLDDAKLEILNILCKDLVNGGLGVNTFQEGMSFALWGEKGCAKTSLMRMLSKILKRPLVTIHMSSITDIDALKGSTSVWKGASYGRIVDCLIQTKCMNPIILFDELDKIPVMRRRDIIGALMQITDKTQNTTYTDSFLKNVTIDLSKCIFVFTYNHPEDVDPILLDRIKKIRVVDYSPKQKAVILEKHIIPRIRDNHNSCTDLVIPTECVDRIVTLFEKDTGLRECEMFVGHIFDTINTVMILRETYDPKLYNKIVNCNNVVSLEIINELHTRLHKNDGSNNTSHLMMYN